MIGSCSSSSSSVAFSSLRDRLAPVFGCASRRTTVIAPARRNQCAERERSAGWSVGQSVGGRMRRVTAASGGSADRPSQPRRCLGPEDDGTNGAVMAPRVNDTEKLLTKPPNDSSPYCCRTLGCCGSRRPASDQVCFLCTASRRQCAINSNEVVRVQVGRDDGDAAADCSARTLECRGGRTLRMRTNE